MGLTVTVLGSSGMFATRERSCSGYLVEFDDKKLWMDAGAGTWRNLLDHADYRDLDGVLLSHRHPDHTTDALQAFHSRQYGGPQPLDPIPLWAPSEAIDHIRSFSPESAKAFDFHAITAESALEIGRARFTFVRMAHPPVTLGVRIEHEQSSFAYSSDSGEDADFKSLAGEAEIFVCEATLQDQDERWEGHMRASQAAAVAGEAGAALLVLTHLPPGRDHHVSLAEARAASDVQAMLAFDGLRLEAKA
jgi:ribonuclease BN (tRNA processing enzyme)